MSQAVAPIIGVSGIGEIGASIIAELPSSPQAAANNPRSTPRRIPAWYSST
jgi:hypothetical protein